MLDKHESVRGSQYCSDAYQARLGELGFLASMSGKGNCYDNAVVETFFKTIKSELIWRTVFMSRSQAETAIARYIDGFYNPVRRHSTLDFTSPALTARFADVPALHVGDAFSFELRFSESFAVSYPAGA